MTLLSVILLLWGVFTLVEGVLNVNSVGPVCAGFAAFVLLTCAFLAWLSVQGRRCYREIHHLLQEFCAHHDCVRGFKLQPIGPFSLVVEQSVP